MLYIKEQEEKQKEKSNFFFLNLRLKIKIKKIFLIIFWNFKNVLFFLSSLHSSGNF